MITLTSVRKTKEITFDDFDKSGDMDIEISEGREVLGSLYLNKEEIIKLRDFLNEQLIIFKTDK